MMPSTAKRGFGSAIPASAGIGLRADHYREVLETRPAVGWFEVHSENYFGAGGLPLHYLEQVRAEYPISLHGVGLSLGSADPLNPDAEAMFDPGGKGSELAIRASGLSAARRLQVYRNNVFASLTRALRACYPVIDRLVGERFFDLAAKDYIRDYPSTSGNLHEFGREYAGFIRAFPPAAELVYLADVARLEWAYQEVFHAPEPNAFGLDGLSSVPPDRYGELRFKLHPASRLLVSEYPILHIWQVNQPGCDGTVDLSEGGVNLLVIRRGLEIQIEALSPAEYALLEDLAQGHVMSYAAAHALKAEPELDRPAWLRRHVARRTIAGFEL